MRNNPDINKQCEKCNSYNSASLEENSFVCAHCNHINVYDNETLKRSMEEIRREIKKIQFKNPKNN